MKRINLIILIILLSTSVFSQSKFLQNKTITGARSYWSLDTMALENARENSMETFGFLERAVDPEKYIVGPGDGFIISIISYEPVQLKLKVSPEGALIIPSVGKVIVNEKKLSDAINLIENKVSEIYDGSEIFVALSKLKKFKVRVSGKVGKSQIINATSMDRASEAIDRVGGLEFDASVRNISLSRKSMDTVLNIDLDEFFWLGIEESNPFLMGGDHITIGSVKDDKLILVSGEVYSEEINIEFSKGDSLAKIIRLAKGFTPNAKLDSVELYRMNQTNDAYERSYLDLSNWSDLMEKPFKDYENDVAVFPGDRIYIRRKDNFELENYVAIKGEVKFPGRYTMTDEGFHLSDLIDIAGGLEEDASLESSVLIRQANIEERDEELERLKQKSLSEMSETEQKYYQVRIRENKGAMVVDFKKALNNPKSEFDVLLKSQDSIIIAKKQSYINIQGKVVKPGLIRYKEGYTYLDYVQLAGGFTTRADEGETFIRKITGEQFLASEKNYKIKPGDLILVPQEPETDFWDAFFKWFTVVTQLITIVSVIITVSNQNN